MKYVKPHLSYRDQVELLISRGLSCDDVDAAEQLLRRIGYYRLSAYWYPLRKPLPEDRKRHSTVHYRLKEFAPGHSFDDAARLYAFDRRLRLHVMDGIEAFEVTLRVQIAHILGRRDPFGHLHLAALDHRAGTIQRRSGLSRHDEWLEKWGQHVSAAKNEDFVKHYLEKYDGHIPVWVATEIMDLGTLIRLFGLMRKDDTNEIARFFGVKTGRTMNGWLLGLNTIRNASAHHSRLWNRNLVHALPHLRTADVGPDLHHIEHLADRRKIYGYLAVLASMLRAADPTTRWPANFRTLVRKAFPPVQGITARQAMSFPEDWESEPVWRHD
ncbi:MAG: Abi family protein [Aeromicrobium sp.]|uniref:Abi family protein n=1 Tax=Aeromicrobium sp. TaxID=1871063 RepID=UPI0039E3A141